MCYSESFKMNAKKVLRNSYILEKLLDEGSEVVGRWIEDERHAAKNRFDKSRYEELDNLYGMWLLERRA